MFRPTHPVIARSEATRQSIYPHMPQDGLLRCARNDVDRASPDRRYTLLIPASTLIAATRRIFTLQARNFFVRSIQELQCSRRQRTAAAHAHDGIDAPFVDHPFVFGVQYRRWVCRFIRIDANDGG